jgi:hypothetical protein
MKSGFESAGFQGVNPLARGGQPGSSKDFILHPSIPSRSGEGKISGAGRSPGLPRPTWGERVGVRGLTLSGLVLVLIVLGSAWAGDRLPFTAEQREVAAAAQQYLEAEVSRDYHTVFRCLYPASDYRKANDFEAYQAEARSTPVEIESFSILNISIQPEMPNREKWPEVEGFARVEVDVTLRYQDSGQKSLVNYDFPFVKEGGRWYKL